MTSKLLALARARKKTAKKSMSVEGQAARARLDKPMRRAQSDAAQDKKLVAQMIHKHEAHDHKGSKPTKFAGGGQISEDSKREAAKLLDEATTHRRMRNLDAAQTLANGAVGLISKGRLRALNAGISGVGALNTAERESKRADAEAEARRIERGMAKPGEEDRKRGGKVCK